MVDEARLTLNRPSLAEKPDEKGTRIVNRHFASFYLSCIMPRSQLHHNHFRSTTRLMGSSPGPKSMMYAFIYLSCSLRVITSLKDCMTSYPGVLHLLRMVTKLTSGAPVILPPFPPAAPASPLFDSRLAHVAVFLQEDRDLSTSLLGLSRICVLRASRQSIVNTSPFK
jgi:hypothetical protein